MQNPVIVAPSILAADFGNLAKEVAAVENAGAKWLHIDVMDGDFVPNISFGAPVYRCLRARSSLFFDVHLMIREPIRYVSDFAAAGADLICFHLEATDRISDTVDAIRKAGCRVGIAIKPATDPERLIPYLNRIDLALVMSVEPGFGGQKFMPAALDKAYRLTELRRQTGSDFSIEMDGGISAANAAAVRESGVNVLVAGSAIFGADDYRTAITEILGLSTS